jgi:hypothetical protein
MTASSARTETTAESVLSDWQPRAFRRADGLIPVVVGVTGHRNPDPSQCAELESRAREFLLRLAGLAPCSPIVLLTPLARGCDRIAARAALSFREANPGRPIEILAPLPLPLDDYRRDFADDPADAAEFEALFAKVDGWFELPGPGMQPGAVAGSVPAGPERDVRYRRLGLYVALQSQVVIAMWDGTRSGKVGGTSEVVDFCLGRLPPGTDCGIPFRCSTPLLAPSDETPVACIPTRRESGPPPAREARSMDFDTCLRQATPAIRAVDDLNARIAFIPRPAWVSAVTTDPDGPRVLGPWRCMARRFIRLDALAADKKRRQMLGAKVIPLLAALGIVSFQWYGSIGLDRFRPHAWISLVAYVLLVVASVLVWLAMTKRHRVEWTFVHARALAEAMRVQLAWTGSGVPGNAPDLYLARRSSDMRQLRVLLRAAVLESGIVVAHGGTSGGVSRGAHWVKEQVDYFSPESVGMTRRRSDVSWWSAVLTALKLLVILLSALLLVDSIPGMLDSGPLAGQESLLCFVVACALAVTVGVSYWQHVTLDREDLEDAARMRDVFGNASRALAEGAVDPRHVLRELGREALDEQAEWFANHRERLRMPDVG